MITSRVLLIQHTQDSDNRKGKGILYQRKRQKGLTMKRLRYDGAHNSNRSNTIRSSNMRHSVKRSIIAVFLLSTTIRANESKVENRGYSSVPYDARGDEDDGQEEGRMSGRGYNANPFEVNVDGTDNIFSKDDNCIPNASGLFGTDQGVEQDLGFYYQVETLPILESVEQAQNEILDVVETSVITTLLPSLFVEECAVIERARQKALIPHRRLAEMLGITTLPEDTVLEGGTPFSPWMEYFVYSFLALYAHLFLIAFVSVECQGELSNELNECFVVDGSATLYSTSAVDPSFLAGLKEIIRKAMNDGYFIDLDPRLIKVSYREDLEKTAVDAGTTGTTSVSGGGSNSLPPYVYAIIGVGAAIIITGSIVAFNKRRKHNGEAELGSFPDQAIHEDVV